MGLLLILPLLVSGYMLCSRNLLIRYRLPQYEGQLLYFRVAYYGVICFIVAFIIVLIFSALFSREWNEGCAASPNDCCWPYFSTDYLSAGAEFIASTYKPWKDGAKVYFFFFLVGALTMLMPYPLAWLHHYLYKRAQEHALGVEITDFSTVEAMILRESLAHLPIVQLLINASVERRPVMVIMEDRKFYIGLISSIGIPSEALGAEEDFGIVAIMGGYLDKDTLEIVSDPRYLDSPSHPNIFLKQNSISSASGLPEDFNSLSKIPFPHRVHGDVEVEKESSEGQVVEGLSSLSSSPFSNLRLRIFAVAALAGFFAPKLIKVISRVSR